MKTIVLIVIVGLASVSAHAQINLDRPAMVGVGDQIYEGVEPGWYYFFPKELCRVTAPTITQQGVRLFADFSVSLCPHQIDEIKSQLIANGIADPKVRLFRGVNVTATAMSLRDAFGSYDPKIEVLSDAGDFLEKTPYRISLYSGTRRRSVQNAQWVMNQLFGAESVDAFVQIEFEFTSIFGGVQRACKSAVSVYIGRGPMTVEIDSFTDKVGVVVKEDQTTGCWNQPVSGVICLR
jgi:hypothetical protein